MNVVIFRVNSLHTSIQFGSFRIVTPIYMLRNHIFRRRMEEVYSSYSSPLLLQHSLVCIRQKKRIWNYIPLAGSKFGVKHFSVQVRLCWIGEYNNVWMDQKRKRKEK